MTVSYQQCSVCVMDTSDPDIVFNEKGQCNHCLGYEATAKQTLRYSQLDSVIETIKKRGKNSDYDVVMGLSGGVDSSYVAYLANTYGLRALAVHMDNGWNSELAVHNIENIVSKLNIDLITEVLDWDLFKAFQVAFFKADVIDIEMITDHAIKAVVYKTALKHRVPTVLSGSNTVTEGIMPKTWNHRKSDWVNIRSIFKAFYKESADSFPHASSFKLDYYRYVRGIKTVPLLNYLPFNKDEAMVVLKDKLQWQYYGGKHYESAFTRFYQAHILPEKFGVDKRKAHLSALICSKQLSRDEALAILQEPLYDPVLLESDTAFFLKKLGLSHDWFEAYLKRPGRSHFDFDSDEALYQFLINVKSVLKRIF